MVRFEPMSTKACKLCIVCINYFFQKARWLRERSKINVDEKKLHFILSDYSFKGRESSPICIIQ